MSPTLRDASGRVISILHDTNETSNYDSHLMHKNQGFSQRVPFHSLLVPHNAPTHSSYASASQRGSMSSYPGTPDLMRSDSYDSQASNEPNSPATPNSACQEPLFPRNLTHNALGLTGLDALSLAAKPKEASTHMYQLPPISSLTGLPSPLEPKHSTPSPNEAYPYDAMVRHSSSSSLEDHHYHRNLDSHEHYMAATAGTDAPMPRSAEAYHDFNRRVSTPPTDTCQAVPEELCDEDDEMSENTSVGKKGIKGKTLATKRYPCKFRETYSCYKTFTTSGHASRHAKIHTAEKTVPCSWPGCNRRFTRSDNMKQHLETHKKDKPRASNRQIRRPSLAAIRRQSSSSRSSASRYSLSRDTPPIMSPRAAADALVSPGLSAETWIRPVASRTPSSGLDALAMVAASESELESQQRRAEQEAAYYQLYQHQSPGQL
ncbi:Transcriptional regulator NRG1 [Cytospora mali]|uniref:Transcriptional regulator NRG1 n=1 Tax=Cytospora mali TaxID=578113 RepID=A0A194UR65_CYTMA|nr:Transcriptional regulator NRG1 [Valsa mali var. pyri (nom. inval.)]